MQDGGKTGQIDDSSAFVTGLAMAYLKRNHDRFHNTIVKI